MSVFGTPDPARLARLAQLSPEAAARKLFEGDFHLGDESALAFAVRKDRRITLDDDALLELLFDALDRGLDVEAFLERARTASQASPSQ